ncbi:MAG: GNAT family N-acetyltransferase [Bacteroides sp.]|nr:GNAT family N-acetyltransferase [Eubacterium sp.]MCM1419349.1 GNAT family N-acetyltransferase [Roseburia sp.]MCM1463187.1 GNAT family N-acetyltransferase [Bacteroides sp.]
MKIEYRFIKNFTEEDLERLFRSVNWVSANYAGRLVKAMKNSDTVVSAWAEGELVGLVNALDDGELTAYIHYLLVDPRYQGKGIGSAMLKLLQKKYKNYLYLILIAENKEVVRFYEKMDFQRADGAVPMEIIKL